MALIKALTKNGENSSMSDGVQREDLKVLIKVLSGLTQADVTVGGSLTVLDNSIVKLNLPTTDPEEAGQLWANSGVVTVSAG